MVAQIIAVTLFLLMFILIITDKWERHVITLGCALLTLVLVFGVGMRSMSAITETLNLGSFFRYYTNRSHCLYFFQHFLLFV